MTWILSRRQLISQNHRRDLRYLYSTFTSRSSIKLRVFIELSALHIMYVTCSPFFFFFSSSPLPWFCSPTIFLSFYVSFLVPWFIPSFHPYFSSLFFIIASSMPWARKGKGRKSERGKGALFMMLKPSLLPHLFSSNPDPHFTKGKNSWNLNLIADERPMSLWPVWAFHNWCWCTFSLFLSTLKPTLFVIQSTFYPSSPSPFSHLWYVYPLHFALLPPKRGTKTN